MQEELQRARSAEEAKANAEKAEFIFKVKDLEQQRATQEDRAWKLEKDVAKARNTIADLQSQLENTRTSTEENLQLQSSRVTELEEQLSKATNGCICCTGRAERVAQCSKWRSSGRNIKERCMHMQQAMQCGVVFIVEHAIRT